MSIIFNPYVFKFMCPEFEKKIYNVRNIILSNKYVYSPNQLYPKFNWEVYKSLYSDLQNMNRYELELHWLKYGRYEGRKYTLTPMKNIIIYTYKFNYHTGGVVALHNLALNLSKLQNEYEIKLYSENGESLNDFYNNFATKSDITEDSIVIYPEVIYGNPLNAKKVIRWLLFDIDKKNDGENLKKSWGINDLWYYWEPKPNKKHLSCPWFNPIFKIIKPINSRNQNKTCYLIKKADNFHNTINYLHPNNSICLDNIYNLEKIRDIFNECKYFYCYDPNCAYIIFAACCGCIPIVYPIDNISSDEYFSTRIYNFRGQIYNKAICYGNDTLNIDKATFEIETLDLFSYYNELFNKYQITILEFVKDIKE